ncbi:MAG: DUF2892 domain-containing protein [Mariprofundaceae bacterium]
MKAENATRIIIGTLIILGLKMAHTAEGLHLYGPEPTWLWMSAALGLVLIMTGLVAWCPLVLLLKKFGLK